MTEIDKEFLEQYWSSYKRLLFESRNDKEFVAIKNLFKKVGKDGGKIFFVGNGASASLSSHAATDLTKQGKIQSLSFNDHNLITALSNDYGYENWVRKTIELYALKRDLVIFLSVSGNSKNILNAAKSCDKRGIKYFSLTGHKKNNSLNNRSKNYIWVDSMSYNSVEIIHHLILLNIVDSIIGKNIYSVSK